MSQPTNGPKREQGQILILFVLVLIVVMGFAAMVIDVGVLRNANQNLWNALDAGALAGAQELPADATNAGGDRPRIRRQELPRRAAVGRHGRLPLHHRQRCRLASAVRRPGGCDPGGNAVWTCNTKICSSICIPAEGDTCNTVVLEDAATVQYGFGGAVGVNTGTTQTVTSAACKGACGAKPQAPVDLVLMVDRTSSMSGVDTVNARAAADAVRRTYNPAEQWMGFGLLGPSRGAGSCATIPDPSIGTANLPPTSDRWVSVRPDRVSALRPTRTTPRRERDGPGHQLLHELERRDRSRRPGDRRGLRADAQRSPDPEVTKGIILMSDGQPNNSTIPTGSSAYCAQSYAAA